MRKSKYLQVAVIVLCITAGNLFAGSLSNAEKSTTDLEGQLNDTRESIDELKSSQQKMNSVISQLDKQMTEISEQITSLETQMTGTETQITAAQEALKQAQADVEKQYEDMKVRIRFMYESSTQSNLDILFGAGNIAELINRTEYIYQISQYDRKMLVKYQNTVEEIAQLANTLEEEQQKLVSLKQQVLTEQEEVSTLLEEKNRQLAQIKTDLSLEMQAQEDILALIRQNLDENSGSGGSSQFIWPCPSSRRVTSDYGKRESPTAGASTDHKGIDIGAASGSDIVAASAGTVSYAGYSKGAGNYITVDHGNGISTIYMHCSSLVAKRGQKVSAGQVIAKVGSTGYSTGPHLHFGVSKNGNYVSPWDYLKRP